MCCLVRDRSDTDWVCVHIEIITLGGSHWATHKGPFIVSRAWEERVSEGAEPSASPWGGSWVFKWYQSVPIARSIGGKYCVQEEAKSLKFSMQEPAPNSGLDWAAQCTISGKITFFVELSTFGTFFVTTLRWESLPRAHTNLKKRSAGFLKTHRMLACSFSFKNVFHVRP